MPDTMTSKMPNDMVALLDELLAKPRQMPSIDPTTNLRTTISKMLDGLNPKERRILAERFGVKAGRDD